MQSCPQTNWPRVIERAKKAPNVGRRPTAGDYKGAQPPYRADKRVERALSARPIYKENKGIISKPYSSHAVRDIDPKPSRGDRPWPNSIQEMCDQLPGVTRCDQASIVPWSLNVLL